MVHSLQEGQAPVPALNQDKIVGTPSSAAPLGAAEEGGLYIQRFWIYESGTGVNASISIPISGRVSGDASI